MFLNCIVLILPSHSCPRTKIEEICNCVGLKARSTDIEYAALQLQGHLNEI